MKQSSQTNVPGQEAVFWNGDSFNGDDTERKQSSFVPNVFPSCISPPTGHLVQENIEWEQDVMEQEWDATDPDPVFSSVTSCYLVCYLVQESDHE